MARTPATGGLDPIFVTRSFLPPWDEYQRLLGEVWESRQLTNQGPLLLRFQEAVESYLGLSGFHFVANGTLALQVALRALNVIGGEVITTPFSYVASASSILWERCSPVFVDIDPSTFCIDPDLIERAITNETRAIMPVHVFGNACDVDSIAAIAAKWGLPVIYDGAHAFGATHGGRSLLSYGDITTCSFHATKPMHTVEGGGIFAADPTVSEKIELIKRFGHNLDEHLTLGINAKASEFHAAMGLCALPHLDSLIAARRELTKLYDSLLADHVQTRANTSDTESNFAYYPVVLRDAGALQRVLSALSEQNIHPRRYFYPTLNTLPYLTTAQSCPIAEDTAERVLCLPLYPGLAENDVERISRVLLHAAGR